MGAQSKAGGLEDWVEAWEARERVVQMLTPNTPAETTPSPEKDREVPVGVVDRGAEVPDVGNVLVAVNHEEENHVNDADEAAHPRKGAKGVNVVGVGRPESVADQNHHVTANAGGVAVGIAVAARLRVIAAVTVKRRKSNRRQEDLVSRRLGPCQTAKQK